MDDKATVSKTTLFSGLFLAALCGWLLVVRPGQLAPDYQHSNIFLFITFAALFSLYLVPWKTHGTAFSIVAVLIFITSDRQVIDHRHVAVSQLNQLCFLACLGVQMIAWTELNTREFSVRFWLVAGIGLVSISALITIEAEETSGYLLIHPSEGWAIIHQRMRNCSFALMILGGILAIILPKKRGSAAWLWLAICLLAPAIGVGIANLYVPARPEHHWQNAHWERLFGDLNRWCSQPNVVQSIEACCWTRPSIVLLLSAVGLWRTLGRGFRQRKKGMMPLAWLIFLASVLLLAALLPASTELNSPVGLLWLGIALSVFAVADLALLLYEQLALPAPEAGPSSVPRV